jgi:hypothetical protein
MKKDLCGEVRAAPANRNAFNPCRPFSWYGFCNIQNLQGPGGYIMKHFRLISKLGVRPEQLIFVCPSCKGVDTKELKPVAKGFLGWHRFIK